MSASIPSLMRPDPNTQICGYLHVAILMFSITLALDSFAAQSGPTINAVINASSFGGGSTIAQGSFIEIYGSNLATTTRTWNASDFSQGQQAPQDLDGVAVQIGGISAYVSYVSPTQINALLSSSTPTGAQKLTVSRTGAPNAVDAGYAVSAPVTVQVAALNPQLWSPSQFKIGGTQYAGAYFPDGVTLALPTNSVPGLLSRPAHPGDTLVFYGIGFGPVVSGWQAGNLYLPGNTQNMQLVKTPQFLFGKEPAQVLYAGLAPGFTGLYQFNVTIPAGVTGGVVPFTVSVPGAAPVSYSIAITTAAKQVTAITDLAGNPNVVVPGSMIVVQGSNFGTATTPITAQYPLPTSLGGVQANFNDYPAPILSFSPQTLVLQVPWEMAGLSQAILTVQNGDGTSVDVNLNVQTASPAILSNAMGYSITIENSNGATPSHATPVVQGQFLDIPVTGLGLLLDAPADGQAATSTYPGTSVRGVMVSIGGNYVPVLSAGLVLGQAAVEMVRVQVPSSTPVGDNIPVVVEAWDLKSSPVSISVAAGKQQFQISPADGTMTPIFSGNGPTYPLQLTGAGNSTIKWTVASMNVPVPPLGVNLGTVGTTPYGPNYYYTGPTGFPTVQYMLITATLNGDPNTFATARVLCTLGAVSFAIEPRDAVIGPQASVTFQAVDGKGNPLSGVAWSINLANPNNALDSTPLNTNVYTPPTQPFSNPVAFAVTATYQGASDKTYLYITPSQPAIVSVSPTFPHVGDVVQITTTGMTPSKVNVYFTRADGSQVVVPSQITNDVAPALIPPDAVEGPIWIQEIGGAGPLDYEMPAASTPAFSLPFHLAVTPWLRLHPKQNQLTPGETTPISVAFLGERRARPLTWYATAGSVDSSGNFTANVNVTSAGPVFSRVTACLTDRNTCGETVIEVSAIRPAPQQPMVPVGQTTQLQETTGGKPVSTTWSALTSNFTIQANGNFQSAIGPLDGGIANLLATTSSASQSVNVAVTGQQSGIVATYQEIPDQISGNVLAPQAFQIVTMGHYAYVVAGSLQPSGGGKTQAWWIDTYDITDPTQPVWLDAIAAPYTIAAQLSYPNQGPGMSKLQSGLLVGATFLEVFDTSGGPPVLKTYSNPTQTPPDYFLNSPASGQNIAWSVGYGTGVVFSQDFSVLGPIVTQPYTLAAVPNDPDGSIYPNSVAVSGTRLYYSIGGVSQPGFLGVFDISKNPAPLLNSVPTPVGAISTLTLMNGFVLAGQNAFSTINDSLQPFPSFNVGGLIDADPSRNRALVADQLGFAVEDLTDPANPKLSGWTPPIDACVDSLFTEQCGGSLALAPGDAFFLVSDEILKTYSTGSAPGPTVGVGFGGGGGAGGSLNGRSFLSGMIAEGSLVFLGMSLANADGLNPHTFEIWDLSGPSPVFVGGYRGTENVWALEIGGHYAYLLCDDTLVTLDISTLNTPTVVGTVALPNGLAMTMAGQYAYVSTYDGTLAQLVTVDLTKPSAPVVVSRINLYQWANDLQVSGTVLAASETTAGLWFLDISKPAAPVNISNFAVVAWQTVWSGNLIYIAAGQDGLVIKDVTNPARPRNVGSNSLGGFGPGMTIYGDGPVATNVYVAGNVAYVGTDDSFSELFGVDVRNPQDPRVIMGARCGIFFVNDPDVPFFGPLTTIDNTLLVGGGCIQGGIVKTVDVTSPSNLILPESLITATGLPIQTFDSPFESTRDVANKPGRRPKESPKSLRMRQLQEGSTSFHNP